MMIKKTRTDLIFVYGSLRKGCDNPMSRLLASEAEFVSDARFQGELFLVRDYPGVIASANTAHQVLGEVYQLRTPAITLAKLDVYEEVGHHFPSPNEYSRQIQKVTSLQGDALFAWIYLYNWPTNQLIKITSGDFCNR